MTEHSHDYKKPPSSPPDHPDGAPKAAAGGGPNAGIGDIAAAIGTRNLWIIILTMPAVFLAVVAIIIVMFGKPGKETGEDPAPQASTQSAVSVSGDTAASAPISLRAGETIKSLTLDGDRLAATIVGPDGEFVVIYDIGKGEEISRIGIKRD